LLPVGGRLVRSDTEVQPIQVVARVWRGVTPSMNVHLPSITVVALTTSLVLAHSHLRLVCHSHA